MNELIEAYIESKKESWSPSTMKSEGYRLRGITKEHLTDPAALYSYLKDERKLKPYPLKTAFVRVGELVDFAMQTGVLPEGRNLVKAYMSEHANKFKQAYRPKSVGITFEEAAARINKIEDQGIREKALELLFTGMRVSESKTVTDDGIVEGKGGWHREVPLAKEMRARDFNRHRSTLYRHLKKIGLTPHMLRKLFATKLVEEGAREADLMKLMGWRSSAMAAVYVQAQREKELNEAIRRLVPKKEKK